MPGSWPPLPLPLVCLGHGGTGAWPGRGPELTADPSPQALCRHVVVAEEISLFAEHPPRAGPRVSPSPASSGPPNSHAGCMVLTLQAGSSQRSQPVRDHLARPGRAGQGWRSTCCWPGLGHGLGAVQAGGSTWRLGKGNPGEVLYLGPGPPGPIEHIGPGRRDSHKPRDTCLSPRHAAAPPTTQGGSGLESWRVSVSPPQCQKPPSSYPLSADPRSTAERGGVKAKGKPSGKPLTSGLQSPYLHIGPTLATEAGGHRGHRGQRLEAGPT